MKKAFSIAAIASLALVASAAAQTNLAVWTMEVPTTPADLIDSAVGPVVPAESGVFAGAGSPLNGTHVSALTDWTTPAGNGSVDSYSSTNWSTAAPLGGDYYQWCTSSIGYQSIMVMWDQTGSNTGPRDFQLSWATAAGGPYTNFGGTEVTIFNGSPFQSWSVAAGVQAAYTHNVDLSTIVALNNAATICFRITQNSLVSVNGAAVAAGGTNRIDNVFVKGTAIPEPATLSLLALGGLLIRRRK